MNITHIKEYLKRWPISTRLLVAFGIFTVCMIGFTELAENVLEDETLAFDEATLRAINEYSSPWLDQFFLIVTDIGGIIASVLLAVFVSGVYIYRKDWSKLIFFASAVGGAVALNTLLKLLFSRARPDLWEQLVVESSFSFPSGHAMASSALAFALIVLLWSTRWRWTALATGAVYVFLVGLSRLYLGVHYPTDVLAGWVMSAAWVTIVWLILEWTRSRYAKSSSNPKSAVQ